MYMYPCDEPEKDRMDILHKLFLVARREVFHSAPVPPNANWGPPRILDLGCGTGIWTIDMADKYPHAEVRRFNAFHVFMHGQRADVCDCRF
jgi:tRNA G46 methylase TrmB